LSFNESKSIWSMSQKYYSYLNRDLDVESDKKIIIKLKSVLIIMK